MVKEFIDHNQKLVFTSAVASLLFGVLIYCTYPLRTNEICNQNAANLRSDSTAANSTIDLTPPETMSSLAKFEPGRVEFRSDSFNKFLAGPVDNKNIFDKWTAIYDIKAHTVYLPDGSMLEAHSGRGDKMDQPNFVHLKDHGPTPPHIYQLSYRERPFHGVQALRLTPRNQKDIYNRVGLLAHPYFLGKRGDSKGCVSFKNYNAFLEAYKKGELKRLAVVASMD